MDVSRQKCPQVTVVQRKNLRTKQKENLRKTKIFEQNRPKYFLHFYFAAIMTDGGVEGKSEFWQEFLPCRVLVPGILDTW